MIPCDGQTVNGSEYDELIGILGTNVVPNLNGRVLQGGDKVNTFIDAGLPSIVHSHTASTSNAGAHTHTIFRSGNGGGNWTGIAGSPSNTYAGDYATSSNGGHTHTITVGNNSSVDSIYGKSSTVQPPAYVVKYYICYRS